MNPETGPRLMNRRYQARLILTRLFLDLRIDEGEFTYEEEDLIDDAVDALAEITNFGPPPWAVRDEL